MEGPKDVNDENFLKPKLKWLCRRDEEGGHTLQIAAMLPSPLGGVRFVQLCRSCGKLITHDISTQRDEQLTLPGFPPGKPS